MRANWWQWQGHVLTLAIKVQPRASRNEIAGVHGDTLKIRLAAPPVDGKANDCLVRFLAESFSVPKSAVTLVHGLSSRDKLVRIDRPRALPALVPPPPPASPR